MTISRYASYFMLEKKLKISVKDFWPGSGGPEKEEHFSKKGYYLAWWWSYSNNGIAISLTLYSVLLVINIRNVMFTKIPQVLHNRWITQGLSLPFWEFCVFFSRLRSSLGQFSSIFEQHTMFKNKLFTKVYAQTNGRHHENCCIKRPSHLRWFCSIRLVFFP